MVMIMKKIERIGVNNIMSIVMEMDIIQDEISRINAEAVMSDTELSIAAELSEYYGGPMGHDQSWWFWHTKYGIWGTDNITGMEIVE